MLLDEDLPLFDRYRTMFSLRNIGDQDSILALAAGLHCSSALFRHEIAFVLGQVQWKCPHCIDFFLSLLGGLSYCIWTVASPAEGWEWKPNGIQIIKWWLVTLYSGAARMCRSTWRHPRSWDWGRDGKVSRSRSWSCCEGELCGGWQQKHLIKCLFSWLHGILIANGWWTTDIISCYSWIMTAIVIYKMSTLNPIPDCFGHGRL